MELTCTRGLQRRLSIQTASIRLKRQHLRVLIESAADLASMSRQARASVPHQEFVGSGTFTARGMPELLTALVAVGYWKHGELLVPARRQMMELGEDSAAAGSSDHRGERSGRHGRRGSQRGAVLCRVAQRPVKET